METKKTFLIATVQDRIDGLVTLLLSSQKYKNSWEYVIVAQKYNNEDKLYLNSIIESIGLHANVIYLDEGIGPGSAKYLGLSTFQSDVWVSLDDDMEMLPVTNYEAMVSIILDRKDIGFISGNWGKTNAQAMKKPISGELVQQPIVYTGGGLMFRDDVAKLILSTEDKPWLFDDVQWSMTAYINGYVNMRYLGSITRHSVCTNGGRNNWVYQKQRELPDTSLIRVRPAFNNKKEMDVGNCWCICISSDLTAKAKEMHKQQRLNRFGGPK